MRLKLYALLSIISLSFVSGNSIAQELFTKKELYHVWILAGEELNAGRFDDALGFYNTHPENPGFSRKSRQISRLKGIGIEAERLRKRGKYADAIDKYKEYRKLTDIGTIGFFENKIEDCLSQINKGRLTELNVQQRIITGFEWAHRGRQKLSLMDTIGAKRDFNNARLLGGNRNNILKEQYIEGIRIVEALTKWGKDKAIKENLNPSKAQELAFLESYRNIRNLDLPDVELKIKEIKSELEGHNSLQEISKLCDIDLLLNYVSLHKEIIPTSGALVNRLKEFRSAQNKINLLKQNTTNAATVESAYASLLSWIPDFPMEIRQEMIACIKNDQFQTFNNFSTLAKNGNDEKGALKFAQIAKLAISESNKETSDINEATPNNCPGLEEFNNGLIVIRLAVANCNVNLAKSLWVKNVSYLSDCKTSKTVLRESKGLKDSVFLMVKNDSLLGVYRQQIQQLLTKGECLKTGKIYEQMKSIRVCNQDIVDEEIVTGLSQTNNCENKTWWRPELTGSIARVTPKYKVGGSHVKMGPGWSQSGGVQFSFIDHKNPVDFTIGLEYYNSNYYSADTYNSVLEDYTIGGANAILNLKLHLPNTNPNKIRPYLKFGAEVMIPVSYKYENYSTFVKVTSTDPLQRTISSVTGALGLEIQKQHFGIFLEAFGNSGLGSMYKSGVSHIATATQKLDAKITKFGIRSGIRLW